MPTVNGLSDILLAVLLAFGIATCAERCDHRESRAHIAECLRLKYEAPECRLAFELGAPLTTPAPVAEPPSKVAVVPPPPGEIAP